MEMAQKLGIRNSKYRHFESQFSDVARAQHWGAISTILDVNEEWLEYGEGGTPPAPTGNTGKGPCTRCQTCRLTVCRGEGRDLRFGRIRHRVILK